MTNQTTLRYDTVSFLSDFGNADAYPGIVRSVIRQLCPPAAVIDLTHEVPPFDVRTGSLLLARCIQYAAPGVILAVVDPGVGTARRAVAIEVADGAATLVGPDNGLLAGAVGMVGGAQRAVSLDNPEYQLATAATTFDGRDVFAPAAAHLCNGVALEELGTEVDTSTLMPGVIPLSRIEDEVVICESLGIDRFGNVQLNVAPDEIEAFGARVQVSVGAQVRIAEVVRTFADLSTGAIGLLVDSDGLMSLVANRASAASELRLEPATEISLSAATDGSTQPVTTAVQLGSGKGSERT